MTSPLRSAIYTRVSSDAGLEQDFNSLDAQRESAEAYIKSQAHEGWRLVRERFDDASANDVSMWSSSTRSTATPARSPISPSWSNSSTRMVRMTLSLAFLDPALIDAACAGTLPRGYGVTRLMDLPARFADQWRALGLTRSA